MYKRTFTKNIDNSKWVTVIGIRFELFYYQGSGPKPVNMGPSPIVLRNDHRRDLVDLLSDEFGEQEKAWCLRWTDNGADVRFRSTANAAQFIMMNTY